MKRRTDRRGSSPVSGGPSPRRFVNAAWQGNEIVLLHRSSGGNLVKHRVPAEHVCYLRARDVSDELREGLRDSRHVLAVKTEGDWIRVRWRTRDACRGACGPGGWFENERIQTYEADVHPIRRYMVDRDIGIQRPRRCYIDIETDSRVTPRKAAEGLARVLCWSLVDDEGTRLLDVLKADTDKAEADLLAALWEALLEYDQVLAWYGDGFDFPIIHQRSGMLNLKVDPRRWLWLDHLEVFRTFNISASESGDEKQSMALGRVAEALGLEGKLDIDASKSWDYWEAGGEDRKRLGEYCLHDASLMVGIEERSGYVELLFTLAEACGVFPDSRAINSTNYVESFLMRLGRDRGEHFRSHWGIERGEQFAGAYVMAPTKRGILRNVHVADFSGMYPSIIQSWNISPETHRPDIVLKEDLLGRPSFLLHVPLNEFPRPDGHCEVPGTDQVFAVEPPGLLSIALDALKQLRSKWTKRKAELPPGTDEWKEADRRSAAYKIGANSFYGVMGSPFSRFFQREVAESVTQAGAWLIKETIRAAEERGFKAVYGDTDSVFVMGCTEEQFAGFCDWCNRELYPQLLRDKGCERNEIDLGYEKAFDRIVLVGKKRYAGRYLHYKGARANDQSKPEIKGLEFKRGDTAQLARRMQAHALDRLLGGGVLGPRRETCEDDPEFFVELVKLWKWKVLNGDLDSRDYTLAKRMSKELRGYARKRKKNGEWAALPPHIEVAHELHKRGFDMSEGVRVEYIVVDGSDSPLKARAAIDCQPGDEDRYYLWESLVYPPTQRVLEACFPAVSWKAYLKARPPKPRKPRARAADGRPQRQRKAPSGQGSLF